MAKSVPFLSTEEIERDAELLLAEFAQTRCVKLVPPIPIEDIIEKHQKLRIEFDDLHELLGVPRPLGQTDILGAIFFDDGRIVVDESLDPEVNPKQEGRYRFTLGHEGGGHWRLHRHLFLKDPRQATFFEMKKPSSVVCRSSQAREPIEWQADYYSACLLMPKALVLDRCDPNRFGTLTGDQLMDFVVRPAAAEFQVSAKAMRIRLEGLGFSFSGRHDELDVEEQEFDSDIEA
ncbi:ImmA/IrrE family metallo-endopeptidase [Dongia sp. agr-C8]